MGVLGKCLWHPVGTYHLALYIYQAMGNLRGNIRERCR